MCKLNYMQAGIRIDLTDLVTCIIHEKKLYDITLNLVMSFFVVVGNQS